MWKKLKQFTFFQPHLASWVMKATWSHALILISFFCHHIFLKEFLLYYWIVIKHFKDPKAKCIADSSLLKYQESCEGLLTEFMLVNLWETGTFLHWPTNSDPVHTKNCLQSLVSDDLLYGVNVHFAIVWPGTAVAAGRWNGLRGGEIILW